MKIKSDWQTINRFTWENPKGIENGVLTLLRIKVFGGWLVKSSRSVTGKDGNQQITDSMTFVSDPNHDWIIDRD